jgi:hypothetical protein
VILVLLGGDPKSEFRVDQIAGDIAAAKSARPLIYAA